AEPYLYESAYATDNSTHFSMLKDYLVLLQPYSKDSEIDSFLKKVDALEIPELMLFSLEQKLKNKDEIPSRLMNKLLEKDDHYFSIYKIYKDVDKLDDLPKIMTEEKIA